MVAVVPLNKPIPEDACIVYIVSALAVVAIDDVEEKPQWRRCLTV